MKNVLAMLFAVYLTSQANAQDKDFFYTLMEESKAHRFCIESLCGKVSEHINKESLRDSLKMDIADSKDQRLFESYARRLKSIVLANNFTRDYDERLRLIFKIKLDENDLNYIKKILPVLIDSATKATEINDQLFQDFFRSVAIIYPYTFNQSIRDLNTLISFAEHSKNPNQVLLALDKFFDQYNEYGRAFYDSLEGIGNGKLTVSWASVKYPSYGISAILHELGHQFSWTIASIRGFQRGHHLYSSPYFSKIWEKRSCINDSLTSYSPGGFITEEGNLAEEKWADYFAQIAIKNLPIYLRSKVKPGACLGIQTFQDYFLSDRFYVDKGIMKVDEETSSHPLRFDRLINTATILFPQLPKTCTSIELIYRPNNCI